MNAENKEFVGVIGAGSFGLTIANLLSHNVHVLLFARRPEVVQQIHEHHYFDHVVISQKVTATNDPKFLAENCTLPTHPLPLSNLDPPLVMTRFIDLLGFGNYWGRFKSWLGGLWSREG